MRHLLALSFVWSIACGGAVAPAVSAGPAAAVTPAETVQLELTLPTALTLYERSQSLAIRDLGGHQVRLEATSRLQQRRQGTGEDYSVMRYQVYEGLEYRQDGEVQALGPGLSGIEQQQVRSYVDRRGRIVEGPESAGAPSRRQMSAAVLALARLLAPMYPSEPVAVGDSWSEPAFLWSTPPLELATIEVERTWTLLALEGQGDERRARIGWEVQLTVQPFEISGVSVAGRGRIEGFSVVRLRDGTSGHAALDLTLEAGPAGASDVLPLFQIEAKIRDRITPSGARRGGLIPSVPPIG